MESISSEIDMYGYYKHCKACKIAMVSEFNINVFPNQVVSVDQYW